MQEFANLTSRLSSESAIQRLATEGARRQQALLVTMTTALAGLFGEER